MADARKLAIQGAVTTTVGLLDAGTFADALLRQERLLMPGGKTDASITEQASKLKTNTPYLQRIATAWEKKPDVIDSFGRTLNGNPGYLKKFQEISARDGADGRMDVSTALFERYAAGGSRELAKAIDVQHRNMFPEQHKAAATAKPAERPHTPAREATESKPAHRPAARTSTPETGKPERVEPIAAAAEPKTPAPTTPVTAPSSATQVATASTNGLVTAESAVPIIQTAVLQYGELFGDEFVPQQEALLKRLETDPALTQRLADIINKDPELRKQLGQTEGSDQNSVMDTFKKLPPEKQTDVRNAIRPYYKQILDDPEKIGNKDFRDKMEGAAVDVATPEWLKGLKNMFSGMDFGNFDFAGLLKPLAELFQKAIGAFQEAFGGGKAMSMVSNVGDSVRSLSSDLSDTLPQMTGKPTTKPEMASIDKTSGQAIEPGANKPKPEDQLRVSTPGQSGVKLTSLENTGMGMGPGGGAAAAGG